MKSYVKLDDASKIMIETFKLFEQKLNHQDFDGYRETNRNYYYYFVAKVIGEDDELWDNPFALLDHIRVRKLVVQNNLGEECIIFKLQSISKYEIDQAIDELVMLVEGPGHYNLIRKNNQTLNLEPTTIFDFLNFFKWNQNVIEE